MVILRFDGDCLSAAERSGQPAAHDYYVRLTARHRGGEAKQGSGWYCGEEVRYGEVAVVSAASAQTHQCHYAGRLHAASESGEGDRRAGHRREWVSE